ncbi:DUF308 domain-containing protein [Fulvivirga ligni]|uniref:DUF308 domain-containing protein n=1 Tax=Fulvivirga ligni TaxID=2904246 RepID=UPI001F3437B2|nr:hypothetical protein [Fulvivirga ligni]UII19002.1 hypothetical protein LVD16_14250 [Fulvivirga ligni]
MSTINQSSEGLHQGAKALRNIYFIRVAFSLIWAISLVISLKSNAFVANILFVIYPLWDAIAIWLDLKANTSEASKVSQYINLIISVLTAIAVALALRAGVPAAMMVIGAWAIIAGLAQLTLGIKRRKALGGQWPMIISGGQSALAGSFFIAMANDPKMGISSLVGYSLFGAFYFLLTAIRLNMKIRKQASLS